MRQGAPAESDVRVLLHKYAQNICASTEVVDPDVLRQWEAARERCIVVSQVRQPYDYQAWKLYSDWDPTGVLPPSTQRLS